MRTAIEQGAGRIVAPMLPKLRYFGDYELLEEIARGGMGVVYRARQVSLDRTVAVKMMLPGVLSSEDEIRRFQAEARTAACMQHPNIVAIHEVGEFDGLHYFSMDFVEGPSLAELVRDKALSPREAAQYVQVLAEAVHYAHGKAILHRDLKPANVLVDAAGRPRITDFGLARPIEGGGMTVTGTLLGTPAYMPPEQAAGEGAPLTPASDCYSLGAILYELLTGAPAFRGASPMAIVRRVIEEAPARPRVVDPAIPPVLEAICLKCLEKDPARRYQSAADLAGDLQRFLRGEGVSIRRRRSRWWLAGAAMLVVLAGLLAILRNRPGPVRLPTAEVVVTPPATIPPAPVVVKKVRPNNLPRPVDPDHGSGMSHVFAFRFTGAPSPLEIEFADGKTGEACRVFVDPVNERVSLQANPLRGPGMRVGGGLGGLEIIENAVCAFDLSQLTYTRTAGFAELRLPATFKPAFAGPKSVHAWRLDPRTGIRQPGPLEGKWTVM